MFPGSLIICLTHQPIRFRVRSGSVPSCPSERSAVHLGQIALAACTVPLSGHFIWGGIGCPLTAD